MTKDTFIKIINKYDEVLSCGSSLYDIGFNLTEGKYPIQTKTEELMDLFLQSQSEQDGVDWINWFMYENDFGRKELLARDYKKLICQTTEDLYEYISVYERNKRVK